MTEQTGVNGSGFQQDSRLLAIRSALAADRYDEAVAEAYKVIRGPDGWKRESEPVWIIACEELLERVSPEWLTQASEMESATLRISIAEALFRLGQIPKCFDVMERLMEMPPQLVTPVISRAGNLLMVLLNANSKRAEPMIESALKIADPATAEILREVKAVVGARWLAHAVQMSLPDPLRRSIASPADLERLKRESAGRTPRLLERIERMSFVAPPPPSHESVKNENASRKFSQAKAFIIGAMVLITLAEFLWKRFAH